jgi:hypothetical protein
MRMRFSFPTCTRSSVATTAHFPELSAWVVRRGLTAFVLTAVSAAVASTVTSAAHAQVVFNNGAPNNLDAFPSNPTVRSYSADTFLFTTTTTFNTVTWFGAYYNGTPGYLPTLPDTFTLSFHNMSGSVPNKTARTGQTFTIGNTATRTATNGAIDGDTVYQYSITLPSALTFSAGTYAISIVNNTISNPRDSWSWATSSLTGTNYYRASPTGSFFAESSGKLAFRLSNAVTAAPEPGSLALLLPVAGVAGMVVRKRHKK